MTTAPTVPDPLDPGIDPAEQQPAEQPAEQPDPARRRHDSRGGG